MRFWFPHALFLLVSLMRDSRSGSLTVIDRLENLEIQHNKAPELVDFVLHQESIEV